MHAIEALKFATPRCGCSFPVLEKFLRMKKAGGISRGFASFDTCLFRERAFHFSQNNGKLRVTEVLLSDNSTLANADTNADFLGERLAYCRLGDRILVMSGGEGSISSALVVVDNGGLSTATVHVTALTVEGDREWPGQPFLCQVSENRALLCFGGGNSMWYCDLENTRLIMQKLATQIPAEKGFYTSPIFLPDGKLLVSGAYPNSNNITLISCNAQPSLESIGRIPGAARHMTSCVLLKDRFVVGFGGYSNGVLLDDLWIF